MHQPTPALDPQHLLERTTPAHIPRTPTPSPNAAVRASRANPGAAAAILFIAPLLQGCLGWGIDDDDVRIIDVAEVQQLLVERDADPRAAVILDPRPANRYERERLPGAINRELPDVPDSGVRDPLIMGHDRIVVYADSSDAAIGMAMAKRLLAAGYDGVRLFEGGLSEWKAAGLPTEPIPGAGEAAPDDRPSGR